MARKICLVPKVTGLPEFVHVVMVRGFLRPPDRIRIVLRNLFFGALESVPPQASAFDMRNECLSTGHLTYLKTNRLITFGLEFLE